MSRIGGALRAHPVVAVIVGAVGLAGAGIAWTVWDQVDVPAVAVDYVVPTAPRLTATADSETVYRVHAGRSEVSYEVEEKLAGRTTTARGVTQGIAGDLVIDRDDPSRSRAGPIVVDVLQLRSDQRLRDDRIRHDFLESRQFPLATFTPDSIVGLPSAIVHGAEVDVEIPGELEVKGKAAPVTVTGIAVVDDGEVRLVAQAEVLMSTFDIGPIKLVGLVSTGDQVTLGFDITFVDPDEVEIPTHLADDSPRSTDDAVAADLPSYATEVLPILESSCASCHVSGGAGAMVWTLDSAADAAAAAPGLDLVVRSGYMPPWPAKGASMPFAHDRSRTEAEIDTLARWAEAGGPLDVEPDTPVKAPAPTTTVRADLDLAMTQPYQGSSHVKNDYRCNVLDPEVTEPTWARAFEFVPDQTEAVHHALAFRVRSDQRALLEEADAADDGPGWTCYSGIGVPGSESVLGSNDTVTQFMAWAPGQDPTRLPEGTGLALRPGDLIVIQVHYHFGHVAAPDQSGMRFELVEPGEEVVDVSYRTYLAAAEIPCRDGMETGPRCDRDAAIDELRDTYGDTVAFFPDAINALCGTSPADAAGMTKGIATASCDYTMSASEVIGIFGHMHEIGSSYRMVLNPGTEKERVLLDIPQWDFAWQLNFTPAERLVLDDGDVIRVECEWDRALLPKPEDRYITWSEGTEDEMCYSALTTVPPPEG